MRRQAVLSPEVDGYCRLMLAEKTGGTYLFLYTSEADGPSQADHWFETLAEARSYAQLNYGVSDEDWVEVADPLPGCQDDWIGPVRVGQQSDGTKAFGEFERWTGSGWVRVPRDD